MIKKITILITVIILASCSEALYNIYGIDLIKEFNASLYEETLENMTDDYDGDFLPIISTDSAFREYIAKFSDLTEKNASQTIQMLYFEGDNLVSYQVSCLAKASRLNGNLDWNHTGSFNKFVPPSAIDLDGVKGTLNNILDIYAIPPSPQKHTIVFFWTNMVQRHSKAAFRTLIQNLKEHYPNTTDTPKIILINTDHFYIGLNEN